MGFHSRKKPYSLYTSSGRADGTQAWWTVAVRPAGHMVARDVYYTEEAGSPEKVWNPVGWEPETVIWPTWPTTAGEESTAEESPLADLQKYWSTAGNRLRDSAKWMATVLGAALATLIGTSPIAGFRGHHPQGIAIAIGAAGLIFLAITMVLVLQVMRPQSVSYPDVQSACPPQEGGRLRRRLYRWLRKFPQYEQLLESPLYKWQQTVESQEDLYLPCGVTSLTSLRQSMIVEEVTLVALARARATARDRTASKRLCRVQAARAARLLELRLAAARIAAVGEYYKLKARSTRATYGGVVCGVIGTAAIVAAFAWPMK